MPKLSKLPKMPKIEEFYRLYSRLPRLKNSGMQAQTAPKNQNFQTIFSMSQTAKVGKSIQSIGSVEVWIILVSVIRICFMLRISDFEIFILLMSPKQ